MCWVYLSLMDSGSTFEVWEWCFPEQVRRFPFPPPVWWSHSADRWAGQPFASPSEQAYSFLLRPLLRGSSGQRASAKQALFIYRQEPRQCVDSSNVHEKRHREGARGSLPKGKWDSPLLSSPPSPSQMSWPQGQCWTSGSKSFLGVVGPWARRNMGPWWPHSSSLGSPASYLRNSSLSLSPFLWASLFFTCNLHTVAKLFSRIHQQEHVRVLGRSEMKHKWKDVFVSKQPWIPQVFVNLKIWVFS